MKCGTFKAAAALAAIAFCLAGGVSNAATWRGATDASGRTWARILIVNQSAKVSNWSISNCRTAKSAGSDAVMTDAAQNWDGAVLPGHSVYVWVYGVLDGSVYLDNADGGSSAFNAASEPVAGADGQWVVNVAADGTVSSDIEPVAPYGTPTQSGTLAVED